jgi:hypothetical protein
MSTTDTGGPAFPSAHQTNWSNPGMTMLDYFAAKAMQGELAAQRVESGQYTDYDALAYRAYRIAEAMVKEKKASGA